MQNTRRRDADTLAIFIALLLFVSVTIAGGVLLSIGNAVFGIPDSAGQVLFAAVVVVAAAAAGAYLVRERRHRD